MKDELKTFEAENSFLWWSKEKFETWIINVNEPENVIKIYYINIEKD